MIGVMLMDIYKCIEYVAPGAGSAEIVFTPRMARKKTLLIHRFDGPGVVMECIIPKSQSGARRHASTTRI